MTEYETCAWCARPSNQPHRPNCPRPGEVFTATDLRNARAEATAAAEQRLRERETPEYFESGLLAAWRRTKDFLADRLITSGRSDVSVNAVLRVMNSAFDEHPPPASPRQGEPVDEHDPEAKCRTCGHREHDHHHSAEPRWCGADFEMLGFTACPCPGYAALSEPAEAGEP